MKKDAKRRPRENNANNGNKAVRQENEDVTSEGNVPTGSDEVEERLRRLEEMQLTRHESHSDVIKFAFFFTMGVLVTVAVYPPLQAALGEHRDAGRHVTPEDGQGRIAGDRVSVVSDAGTVNRTKHVSDDHVVEAEPRDIVTELDDAVVIERKGRVTDDVHTSDSRANKFQTEQAKGHSGRVQDNKKPRKSSHERSSGDLMMDEDEHTQEKALNTGARSSQDSTVVIKDKPVAIDSSIDEGLDGQEVKLVPLDVEEETKLSEQSHKPTVKESKSKTMNSKKNKSSDSKSNKETTKSSKQSEKENQPNIPDEVKNFRPTFQKEVTTKKIFADGRRIPPTELLPQKPNNGSVR